MQIGHTYKPDEDGPETLTIPENISSASHQMCVYYTGAKVRQRLQNGKISSDSRQIYETVAIDKHTFW